MESLTSITRRIIVVLFALLISASIAAQDYKILQKAFEESYSLEQEGEYSQSAEALKSVYDENSYEINLRLGWVSYMAGLFSESVAYYSRAITLMPYSIEARLGFAYPASAMGNWTQVITKYEEILEIDPNNSVVNYRLGSIYYGKNEFQKAYTYLEKVINHYPFDYDLSLLYAWTNYQLGKLREAKVLFNKVLLIKPGDESAIEGLSLIK
jgi:tetratricopeptide (TPR) repeat protein